MITNRKLQMTLAFTIALALTGCENEIVKPVSNSPTKTVQPNTNSRHPKHAVTARISTVDSTPVDLFVRGTDGATITVNWGDGTSDNLILNKNDVHVGHMYATVGWHDVSITGDIDQITGMTPFQSTEYVVGLDLSQMRNLKEIDFPYMSVDVLDLSKNTKIEAIASLYSNLTTNILLPGQHNVKSIEFGGDGYTTEVVNKIIQSVYRNATRKGIYNGRFGLSSQELEFPTFAGPPSERSMEMLRTLRDQYGWEIFPNP